MSDIHPLFIHPFPTGMPKIATAFGANEALPGDTAVTERVIAAYEAAARDPGTERGAKDLWSGILGRHKPMVTMIKKRDIGPLTQYLRDMFQNPITHGTDQGADIHQALATAKESRDHVSLDQYDKLVALAEALGAIPLENPEQGAWGKSCYLTPDELLDAIEGQLGFDISPPPVNHGLFGLTTKRGLYSVRDFNALYVAHRIRELLPNQPDAAICEIGAGVGRVAYYCHRMGLKNYTIIDLSTVNVAQGWLLNCSLPDAEVRLCGETSIDTKEASIKVLPTWAFAQMPDRSFDLVVNQDSIPEIDRDVSLGYLHQIKSKSKGMFLSINQEAAVKIGIGRAFRHSITQELIDEVGGFRRNYRFHYWLRRGYVEELFSTTS